MQELRFTFLEMLSLIGVFQCVYIIVYIIFRVSQIKQIILPVLYFLVLGAAFFLDFGKEYIGSLLPYYDMALWLAWNLVLPLSVLLIIQMAQINKLPSFVFWLVLLLTPIAALSALILTNNDLSFECNFQAPCRQLLDWLRITGMVSGALGLLLIWLKRNILEDMQNQKTGKERYWLILSLVMVNIAFLIVAGIGVDTVSDFQADLTRTIIGLVFVYLVTTSLFRIYPQALNLVEPRKRSLELNIEEKNLAQKIHNLLTLDKVYHEPTYSRADLAKELGVSEASVSKIINICYQKSLPQLLNEQRIEDAKRLLLDTNANIKIVAQEVGFNSIPSFNRVFKELEGCSPSDYRKNIIK